MFEGTNNIPMPSTYQYIYIQICWSTLPEGHVEHEVEDQEKVTGAEKVECYMNICIAKVVTDLCLQ